MCALEPMVELQGRGRPRLNYGHASAQQVSEIFAHYYDGQPLHQAVVIGEVLPTVTQADGHALHSLSFVQPDSREPIAFHNKQLRIVLSNCGLIDPECIDDYLALDGYVALEQVAGQHDAGSGDRRRSRRPGCAGGAAAASRPASSGAWPARRSAGPNTSSATPTRATLARSWTAPRWRATRTR